MKLIPVLFSPLMVTAIKNGKKTVTRRLKFEGNPGDIIWVRERWRIDPATQTVRYWDLDSPEEREKFRYSPGIHLPFQHHRLALEVTNVHRERLKTISERECREEGFPSFWDFRQLWNQLNEPREAGYDQNPEVDVVRFRIRPTLNPIPLINAEHLEMKECGDCHRRRHGRTCTVLKRAKEKPTLAPTAWYFDPLAQRGADVCHSRVTDESIALAANRRRGNN